MEKEEISTPMLEKIYDTIKQLKEIDIYFNEELPNRQSKVNEELSDLYHYIQSLDKIPNGKQSQNLIKLIKEKRRERAMLNNEYELKVAYNNHRNKLSYANQIEFFEKEIHKKAKELNTTYRYRQFSNDKIEEMLKE